MVNVIVQGLLMGGVYALVALGLVLVFKSSQVMNLAYGWVICLLAYFLYQFMGCWGLPAWVAIPILMVAGAAVAMLLERVAIRPLMGQSFLAVLMMTLMAGNVLHGIMVFLWPAKEWAIPFRPQGMWTIGSIHIMPDAAISSAVGLGVFLLLVLLFRYTKIGLSMRVVAADHEVAQSLGIRVNRIFSLSWAASGVLGAVCAVLLGMVYAVTFSIADVGVGKGMVILLVGGLTSIPGALVGGLLFGVSETLGSYWLQDFGVIIPWIFMMIVLLVRPHGLLGQKRIERI